MSDTPTLYEWAGGGPAIRRLIDAFYDRVERDDLLTLLFPGGVSEEHRANVVLWWSEVLGGPADYTDQLGGYSGCLPTTAICGSRLSRGFASPRR